MPEDAGFDRTLSVLKEGYEFIMNRSESLDSDVFETRIMGEKAICLTGSEAAELFYDDTRFRRRDAAPSRVEKTLFGEGGVQGLDGERHGNRKAMLMALMDNEGMDEIEMLVHHYWQQYFEAAGSLETVALYEAAKVVFLQVAAKWTGVPLEESETEERAAQVSDLFESPAALGLQHWKGRRARSKANDWIEGFVEEVREGTLDVDNGKALHTFSWHRDEKVNCWIKGL